MFKAIFDKGICIPIPNPWLKGLALRLLRFDADPSDFRIGVTVQLEWGVPPTP